MRGISCTSVVFPLPVCPTMATVAPAGIRRLILSSALPAGCSTVTPRNSISPRSGSGQRARDRRLVDGRPLLEDGVDPLEGGRAPLDQVHYPAEGDHGPDQHHHVCAEHHELAQADAPREQPRPSRPQHDQHGHAHQGFEHRHEGARKPSQPDVLPDVIQVELLEQPQLGLLLHVGADHANSRDVLLGAAADVGEHSLDVLEAVVNPASEQAHSQADERGGQERYQREAPVHIEHDGSHDDERETGLGSVHEPRPEHHAHRVQIVGGARHDVAGAHAPVEIRRKRGEPPEEVVAKVVLDVPGDADQDHAHPILEDALEGGEAHDGGRKPQHRLEAEAGALHGIHAPADEDGEHGGHDVLDQQAPRCRRRPGAGSAAGTARESEGSLSSRQIPNHPATVFIHSSTNCFWPWRVFHQSPGRKNSSWAAITRNSTSGAAERKIPPARRVW